MKRVLLLLCVIILSSGMAIANGLSLNSIGPRSGGMGGAFVGLADDYSTIYWNPAGMSQLKGTQVSLFVSDIIPLSTYKSEFTSPIDGSKIPIDATAKTNHYINPNIMGYFPLLEGDLTIGIGAYIPAGLGAEWNGEELKYASGGIAFEWMSKIGVLNISPAVAYKINDVLSIGAAFNLYYGMFDLKRPQLVGVSVVQYEEESTGIGMGLTAGVLFKPVKDMGIGVSFRTKNTVAFKGTAKNTAFKNLGKEESDLERDLAWPMWLGGGISYKIMDNLTIAFDAQFSQWSATQDTIVTEYSEWNSMLPIEKRTMEMHWVDALQIRFGAQYDFSQDFALRAGYYYDPAPAPDETLNILFPSNTYNALTFGVSYKIIEDLGIDFVFEYLAGDEREITKPYPGYDPSKGVFPINMLGKHQTDIIAVVFGLNYVLFK